MYYLILLLHTHSPHDNSSRGSWSWYLVKHSFSRLVCSLVPQLTEARVTTHDPDPKGSICKAASEYFMQAEWLIRPVATSWNTTWNRALHFYRYSREIFTWADMQVGMGKASIALLTPHPCPTIPGSTQGRVLIIFLSAVCMPITYLEEYKEAFILIIYCLMNILCLYNKYWRKLRENRAWFMSHLFLLNTLGIPTTSHHACLQWAWQGMGYPMSGLAHTLSLIHIWRCRRYSLCRSRWSPYH